jgi:L-ascorbate metabolism protein UlaG (beta-lactamase superfamily)
MIEAFTNPLPDGLWWLGQSGFMWVRNGRGILLDPYLSDSLTRKYAGTDKPHVRITPLVIEPEKLGATGIFDLVTSSHNHTDHLDAETLLPILGSNPQVRLLIPAANREFVLGRLGIEVAPRLVELDSGGTTRIGDIEITAVASAHPTVERDKAGRCHFLGYVVSWNGLRIYHSGDTLWHDGLVPALKPLNVDLALLPINGDRPERRVAGNLDGPQAARLAHEIGARCVVPCHYDLFEFNTASPEDFQKECERLGQPYRIMRNGEYWDLKIPGG